MTPKYLLNGSRSTLPMTEDCIFDELKYRIIRNDKGVVYYNSNNELHRDNDLPAVIHADGTQYWWVGGRLHRDNDLPAVIHADGSQYWYVNGELHRDNDLPAVIHADGSQKWWVNGRFIK